MIRLSPFSDAASEKDWIQSVLFSGRLSRISQHIALFIHGRRSGPDGLTMEDIQAETGWGKTAIRAALAELEAEGIDIRCRVMCSYCGAWVSGSSCHSDHVLAKSLGGSDQSDNRVPACQRCNSRKSDRPFLLWLLNAGGNP